MNPHDSITNPVSGRPPGFEMRPRLIAAFLGMGVVILVASVFAALIISNVQTDSERLITDISRRASLVAGLRQEFLLLRVAEKNLIIEDTQEGMDVFQKRIETSEAQIDETISEFDENLSEEERARLTEFRAGFTDYRASLDKMIVLSREHTLAQAAELSRGKGREHFQSARQSLLSLIERGRELIANAASNGHDESRVDQLTRFVGTSREALEGLHDLQYLEQAILTVFSEAERVSLGGKLEAQIEGVREFRRELGQSAQASDQADLGDFDRAFEGWIANNVEVRRLAQQDTKAAAMALSTSAVRDAYLRASQSLDALMQQSDAAAGNIRSRHDKAMSTGRGLIFTVALIGLLVVGLIVWVVAGLVMREFRAAADVLLRAP